MFTNETNNPADHADHDPSRCDYARIWLTQQFNAGTHVEHVKKLTNEQIAKVGFTSAVYSSYPDLADLYAEYNITLAQLYTFSEYLRNFLIVDRGLGKLMGDALGAIPQGDPNLN